MEVAKFDEELHKIQQNIHKRLFKKIDYNGATEELLELAGALRREGNAPHAAICCMSAAHCQRALESPLKAANLEVQAGELLWREEAKKINSEDDKTFRELLPEAINCYLCAISVYMQHEKFGLASSLYAEMGQHLYDIGETCDAAIYLEKAAQLVETQSPFLSESLIRKSIQSRIEAGDYSAASDSLHWLMTILQRRSARSSSQGAVADVIEDQAGVAQAMLSDCIIQIILENYTEARSSLETLHQHAAANLPSGEIHTTLSPLIAAFIDACQSRSRRDACYLQEEISELVEPSHSDLMLRCIPRC
ncbi:hypothetical protein GUITHDRAFT_153459 [Guillardia theta CCMP2712]|uniref:MalT-like TPR region domain-containing protein n=1 Tax=Guillardia theta (strain CCMP2712) TaxID=905079 RepID=L1J443_GUITC|nr:hypothetical protein GUITHDRAFT_153459 [Guillardia theta CCMP2712]EKX42855.1 hypothetical protein GUITHDRAFT_153459 [Guillardia theta CCMP2712]|eukprot:XP_005829835.1 hypothetical protein GUITHDRAFT_153459 [Guillardia theta CCMP2712]